MPGGFPIGLRGEFRDFYALSQPTYPVAVTGGSQHNLTVGAGLTVRFSLQSNSRLQQAR